MIRAALGSQTNALSVQQGPGESGHHAGAHAMRAGLQQASFRWIWRARELPLFASFCIRQTGLNSPFFWHRISNKHLDSWCPNSVTAASAAQKLHFFILREIRSLWQEHTNILYIALLSLIRHRDCTSTETPGTSDSRHSLPQSVQNISLQAAYPGFDIKIVLFINIRPVLPGGHLFHPSHHPPTPP